MFARQLGNAGLRASASEAFHRNLNRSLHGPEQDIHCNLHNNISRAAYMHCQLEEGATAPNITQNQSQCTLCPVLQKPVVKQLEGVDGCKWTSLILRNKESQSSMTLSIMCCSKLHCLSREYVLAAHGA